MLEARVEETAISDGDLAARLAELETEVVMLRETLSRLLGACPAGCHVNQSPDNLALRWWGGRWT